jgi:hypothetical protein
MPHVLNFKTCTYQQRFLPLNITVNLSCGEIEENSLFTFCCRFGHQKQVYAVSMHFPLLYSHLLNFVCVVVK